MAKVAEDMKEKERLVALKRE
jgi:Ca2+-binding EF-hand superfamily protein